MKIYRLICIVLFIVLLILIISGYRQKYTKQTQPIAYQVYTVQPGDSLWKIAKLYTKGDPRKLIYEIRKLNDITPEIYPGQEIKIPVK